MSSQNAFHVEGQTLSVRHAAEPTHDGAEARITLPTRSCAPSHFVTLAAGSHLMFCVSVLHACSSGLFPRLLDEKRGCREYKLLAHPALLARPPGNVSSIGSKVSQCHTARQTKGRIVQQQPRTSVDIGGDDGISGVNRRATAASSGQQTASYHRQHRHSTRDHHSWRP